VNAVINLLDVEVQNVRFPGMGFVKLSVKLGDVCMYVTLVRIWIEFQCLKFPDVFSNIFPPVIYLIYGADRNIL
jgi:hypothetical protein